ncbi:MAG: hypothetical protein Q4G33_10710 [bacterium]|nr:hypothetical protein [bacterium]
MVRLKKLFSVIITLSMLAALLVQPAQAALGINHELEVSVVAALGIVPGYPSNYSAQEPVKQSDFIKYAYAAVGVDIDNADSMAANFGMDGASDITVDRAERVIFAVSDYDKVMGAIEANIHSSAQKLGLLNGVSNAIPDAVVNMEMASVMLYNMLELSAIKIENNSYFFGDKTIMEDKLNVYYEKGVVTSTNQTGLEGYSNTSANDVRIDDEVYNVGNTSAQLLFGRYVKFYYKEDKSSGEYVLKWIECDNSRNTIEIIYGCDITSASRDIIHYDSNTGSNKSARLESDADIIYNGSRSDNVTIDAVRSLTCEVTLIDNDGSGKYDVAIIKDYTYYYVDAFSSSTLIVNDYQSKQTLDLDENNYTSLQIYKDGIKASVSDIVQGQVLAAAVSEDGSIAAVEILSGSVSGEITAYNTDSIAIGGVEYDISPAYAGDRLKSGRSGTFYFDKLGKVVRCTALKAQTSKYGYLMNFYSKTDGNGSFFARMLTADGNVIDIPVNDKISYNNTKSSSGDVMRILNAGGSCEQLITYSVNGDNSITQIKTADTNYIGVDEENIDKFTLNYTGTGRYRKNNMCFNSKYLIDSTTPIFIVPYDGERDEYTVKNSSYLTNNYIYNISVYDIDEFMYGSAIVLKENLIEPENLRNKRPLIVTSVLSGVNEDNEETLIVKGFQNGSSVTYTLANDEINDNRGQLAAKDLVKGDVIMFGTNSKDEINTIQLMYRASSKRLSIASGTSSTDTYWEGGTAVFPDLWVSCGSVVNRNSELIMVDDDGDDTKASKSPHVLGNAVTYLYEDNNLSVSNKNEIAVGDTVYVHEYQGRVQDVLIVRD